jgi:hypothetical protein
MIRVIRRFIVGLAALSCTLMLAGCGSASMTCTVKVSTESKADAVGAGAGAGANGIAVSGELVASGMQQKLAATFSSSLPDAASFTMDTSGSTILWPSSGVIVLTITQISTGSVVASSSFTYVKNGTVLSFANPSVVNQWLQSMNADPSNFRLGYQLSSFSVIPQQGTNVVKVAALQDNTVQATSMSTFEGVSACPRQPHPNRCAY